MVAITVASVSSKCFVPIQGTALGSWHREGHRRFQLPKSFRHGASLRTFSSQRNVVPASSSQQNVSATNLSEERHGDDAAAENLRPNYELLLKEKAAELRDDLHGTCIFLTAMTWYNKPQVDRNI